MSMPHHEVAPRPVGGREALQRLREGNDRFANGGRDTFIKVRSGGKNWLLANIPSQQS